MYLNGTIHTSATKIHRQYCSFSDEIIVVLFKNLLCYTLFARDIFNNLELIEIYQNLSKIYFNLYAENVLKIIKTIELQILLII